MAVLPDGEAVVQSSFSASSSHTLEDKTTAGSDRVGFVAIGGQRFGGAPAVSAVTWGGAACEEIFTEEDSDAVFASLWLIIDPPTAASDVVITMGNCYGYAGAIGVNGADQTTPVRDADFTLIGASTAIGTTVDSGDDDLLIDCLGNYNLDAAADGGQTEWFTGNAAGTIFGSGSYKTGSAPSESASWTLADTTQIGVHILASVQPAAGGGGSILPLVACDMDNIRDMGGMRG